MIKFEIDNTIGVVTLNRPEKRNALNPELIYEFKKILKDSEKNDNVKILIITGEGDTFCAGADLIYLNDLSKYSSIENEKDSESLAELFLMLYEYPKPTIAAVNGLAIAGGCGLATVCDFIVADLNKAKFGYTEVSIGFIPAIVSVFLIKRTNESLAKQLLMSGELINSKRAYEIGLINQLSENVMKDSKVLAENLLKNSPYSLSQTKKMIRSISNLNVKGAVDYCIRLNTINRASKDFTEGLSKFINKKTGGK